MTCVWLMRDIAIAVDAMFVSDVRRKQWLRAGASEFSWYYWLRGGAHEEMERIDETSVKLTEHRQGCAWWKSLYGDEELW